MGTYLSIQHETLLLNKMPDRIPWSVNADSHSIDLPHVTSTCYIYHKYIIISNITLNNLSIVVDKFAVDELLGVNKYLLQYLI